MLPDCYVHFANDGDATQKLSCLADGCPTNHFRNSQMHTTEPHNSIERNKNKCIELEFRWSISFFPLISYALITLYTHCQCMCELWANTWLHNISVHQSKLKIFTIVCICISLSGNRLIQNFGTCCKCFHEIVFFFYLHISEYVSMAGWIFHSEANVQKYGITISRSSLTIKTFLTSN